MRLKPLLQRSIMPSANSAATASWPSLTPRTELLSASRNASAWQTSAKSSGKGRPPTYFPRTLNAQPQTCFGAGLGKPSGISFPYCPEPFEVFACVSRCIVHQSGRTRNTRIAANIQSASAISGTSSPVRA
jgi:hypothetical protein